MVKGKQTGSSRRILPSNPAAEASVLGGCIINPELVSRVRGIVAVDDFFAERNRIVYGALLDLADSGRPIDQISLADQLAAKGELDKAGGKPYVIELANSTLSQLSCIDHARIVARCSTQRCLIKTAIDISAMAYDDQEDEAEIVAESFRMIARAAVSRRKARGDADAESERLFSMGLELIGMAVAR